MTFEPKESLNQVKDHCKVLEIRHLKELCNRVSSLIIEEPNVNMLNSPIIVCGDIHGQFFDLKAMIERVGDITTNYTHNFLFLGDYVDRGPHGVETMTLLLLMKLIAPERVTLLRGNHESRQTTQTYGFYDECLKKYGGDPTAWKLFTSVFDLFAFAVVIDYEMFCVHGGLSPTAETIDKIRILPRNQEFPVSGSMVDLVWSDPDESISDFAPSVRGAGFLFGSSAVDKFLYKNDVKRICRSHQLVQEGIDYKFNNTVITVWSAPNYCFRCGNKAVVLIKNGDNCKPVQFDHSPIPSEFNLSFATEYYL